MDLNDVRGIVAQAQEACWDAEVTMGELASIYEGGFHLSPTRQMTTTARSELLAKTGVPSTFHGREFFDKLGATTQMRVVQDAVKANDLEYKPVLVRFFDDTLRAVVSDNYTCVPHLAVVDALIGLDLDLEVKRLWPDRFDWDTKTMHLRLTKPRDYSIGNNGDVVKVMMHVVNSEVGTSALMLDSGLWRQICSNGLMAKIGAVILQERHVYKDPNELIDIFSNAAREAEDVAMRFLEILCASKGVTIDPALAMTRLPPMSGKMRDRVRELFTDNTLFGYYNALTQAAQSLSWQSQVEMEKRARTVLDMDWTPVPEHEHVENCPTCGRPT